VAVAKPDAVDPAPTQPAPKTINVALQGGGAHGAFAWGALDKLLEDGRLAIEGISGTSAGSMNAAVLAFGLAKGGPEDARQRLHDFWKAISNAGRFYSPVEHLPWEALFAVWNPGFSPSFEWFRALTRYFSPYQLNPFDVNPLRDAITELVDFDALRSCRVAKLFLSATNVRTGKVRVFTTKEITTDVVMASACLPDLFKAVEIAGEHYWDGGYMGNPCLFPLIYHTTCKDIVILHINPIERPDLPIVASDIFNRVNEITFNSSLLRELRAIAFVQTIMDRGWIKDEYRSKLARVRLHSIRADAALRDLSVASKFANDWDFLCMLRDRGRAETTRWLAKSYDAIGERSSIDLGAEFLGSGADQDDAAPPQAS
jgi:NTE family protein